MSSFVASRASLAAAKIQLGHESLSTTIRYTHPGMAELTEVATKLNTEIKGMIPKSLDIKSE